MGKKAIAKAYVGFIYGSFLKVQHVHVYKTTESFDEFQEELRKTNGDQISGRFAATADVDVHFDEVLKQCEEFKVAEDIFKCPITKMANIIKQVTSAKKLSHFGPEEDESGEEDEKKPKATKEDEDEDEEKPKDKKPAKKSKKEEEPEEEEKPKDKKPVKKAKKEEEPEEVEEDKAKEKKPAKKSKKEEKEEEAEEPEEEEKEEKKKKPAKKSAKKEEDDSE